MDLQVDLPPRPHSQPFTSCGSMTHKTKDCLERPRVKGAKLTNKNIAADDKVEDIHLSGFDAKRDRWNGYDARDYAQVRLLVSVEGATYLIAPVSGYWTWPDNCAHCASVITLLRSDR
jgi:hypothetical protein